MRFKKITPVVLVEEIEPCLGFWTERLGFEVAAQVPQGDKLGFVMLSREGTEVMLQTRASVEQDIAALATGPLAKDGISLFIEVQGGLDPWVEKLEGLEVVVPRRKTFYGADEFGVRSPGGVVVVLASFETDAEGGE